MIAFFVEYMKFLNKIYLIVLIWLLALIFRDGIISLVLRFFPIISSVPNNNWLIQIAYIAIVILLYVVDLKNILNQRYWYSYRLLYIIALTFFVLLFRSSDIVEFNHVPGMPISYLDVSLTLSLSIELIFMICLFFKKEEQMEPDDSISSFVYDNPVKIDDFRREEHAISLVNKIVSTLSSDIESSFCILLNEQYGVGKTSFLNLIKKNADIAKLEYVEFRPWLSESPSQMMQDFLLRLEEEFRISYPSLAKELQAYARVISGIRVGFLELAFNRDLKPQSLTNRRKAIEDKMKDNRKPLLVLVDDVDRLDSSELLALLKIIRNTADFPYLCYVLAADKESITQNLRNEGIVNTDLYLRKFFNLELSLPPVDNEVLDILRYKLENILKELVELNVDVYRCAQSIVNLESIRDVFITPRDVYRFINLLSYTFDLMKKSEILKEVNAMDVILITLIQFISPEWYKVLRDRNDKILNYNISNGRYSLKDGWASVFNNDSIQDASKSNNGAVNNSELNVSFNELIVKTQRDPMNALKSIILNMFSSNDSKIKDRICYRSEYFKYFAGHYRNNELTTAEAFAFINSSYTNFSKEMGGVLHEDKVSSFLHKMSLFVEENVDKDRVDLLKKTMKAAQRKYHFHPNDSISILYPNSIEEQIIKKLFITTGNNSNLLTDTIIRNGRKGLEDMITGDTRYPFLCLVLGSFVVMNDYHFVYGDDFPLHLKTKLIDTFINKELKQNKKILGSICIIPYLRDLYPVYWEQSFRDFILESPEPLPWIYLIIKRDKDTTIWDNDYIHSVFKDDTEYMKISKELYDKNKMSSDIYSDLINLFRTRFGIFQTTKHPFIDASLEWQRNNIKTKKRKKNNIC